MYFFMKKKTKQDLINIGTGKKLFNKIYAKFYLKKFKC